MDAYFILFWETQGIINYVYYAQQIRRFWEAIKWKRRHKT